MPDIEAPSWWFDSQGRPPWAVGWGAQKLEDTGTTFSKWVEGVTTFDIKAGNDLALHGH
jgi:hypothetical protein